MDLGSIGTRLEGSILGVGVGPSIKQHRQNKDIFKKFLKKLRKNINLPKISFLNITKKFEKKSKYIFELIFLQKQHFQKTFQKTSKSIKNLKHVLIKI